jgi:hypothetical protein
MNTIPLINVWLAVLVICLCAFALTSKSPAAGRKTLYAILAVTIALAVLLAVIIFAPRLR